MEQKRLLKNRIVLAIILILFLSASVNLIRNINSTSNTDDQGKPYDISDQIKTPQVPNKTFKSQNLGLEFVYPNEWNVSQGFSEQYGLGQTPSLSVKSPSGVAISIEPSYTSVQAGCQHNIFDKPHNTLDCTTIEVLSRQKINLKSPEGDVYIIRALYTPARAKGSSAPTPSKYVVMISSDQKLVNSQTALAGNWLDKGIVMLDDKYLTVSIDGVSGYDKNFYQNPDIKQAEQILSTLANYN